MKPSEDTRACGRAGCGHERRVHDHYAHSTHCSLTGCLCRKWHRPRRENTGFIDILLLISGHEEGSLSPLKKWRVIITAWARELWLDVAYEPWRLVPHLRSPRRIPAGDGYVCSRCGSRSARVQAAGQRVAEMRRRQFS